MISDNTSVFTLQFKTLEENLELKPGESLRLIGDIGPNVTLVLKGGSLIVEGNVCAGAKIIIEGDDTCSAHVTGSVGADVNISSPGDIYIGQHVGKKRHWKGSPVGARTILKGSYIACGDIAPQVNIHSEDGITVGMLGAYAHLFTTGEVSCRNVGSDAFVMGSTVVCGEVGPRASVMSIKLGGIFSPTLNAMYLTMNSENDPVDPVTAKVCKGSDLPRLTTGCGGVLAEVAEQVRKRATAIDEGMAEAARQTLGSEELGGSFVFRWQAQGGIFQKIHGPETTSFTAPTAPTHRDHRPQRGVGPARPLTA